MIPKVIYICDKNLNFIKEHSKKWKELNPEYEIKLFDNKMCQDFLKKEMGDIYLQTFDFIPNGPIKADFWRVCILYKYGGVYADADIQPLVSIKDFIEKDIDFLTCSSCWTKLGFFYNPHFILSTKDNIILKQVIDKYIHFFKSKKKYKYWDWSILNMFKQTLNIENYKNEEGIFYYKNMKIQILKEIQPKIRGKNTHNKMYSTYKSIKILNNRSNNWDYKKHKAK